MRRVPEYSAGRVSGRSIWSKSEVSPARVTQAETGSSRRAKARFGVQHERAEPRPTRA